MDVPWMAWIKCAMETLGVQPKQLDIQNDFGSSFRFFLMFVISNARMTILITSIANRGVCNYKKWIGSTLIVSCGKCGP
jgi:hypothetical protein